MHLRTTPKSFFFIFSFLVAFAFITVSPVAAFSISTNPDRVNYGGSETITISNIPQSDAVYFLRLGPASIQDCNTTVGSFDQIKITGKCSVDQVSGIWMGTPTCTNQTFTGTLDTSKVLPKELSDSDFTVRACLAGSDGTLLEDQFTVSALNPNNAFKIEFVFNHDGSTNTSSTPASPGEQIGVRLSGSKNGDYGLRIAGGKIESTKCVNSACTLYGTIPDNIDTPSTEIIVADPDGKTQSSTVYLKSTVSSKATPSPTPDPSPTPPKPPCNDPQYSADNDYIGCRAVSTGLGVTFPTDPAGFIQRIFSLLLSLSGGIAILLIIRSGYILMTSQGDHERTKEAREILTSAVIGLLFLIFSLVILEVIGVDILHIPGFHR